MHPSPPLTLCSLGVVISNRSRSYSAPLFTLSAPPSHLEQLSADAGSREMCLVQLAASTWAHDIKCFDVPPRELVHDTSDVSAACFMYSPPQPPQQYSWTTPPPSPSSTTTPRLHAKYQSCAGSCGRCRALPSSSIVRSPTPTTPSSLASCTPYPHSCPSRPPPSQTHILVLRLQNVELFPASASYRTPHPHHHRFFVLNIDVA